LPQTWASERITLENRQLLKSEVGARAIIDLEEPDAAQLDSPGAEIDLL
jgi:hypothetical protein